MRYTVVLTLAALAACASPQPAAPPAGTVAAPAVGPGAAPVPAPPSSRKVEVATLAADRDAHKVPVLVDVRSPEEYTSGHVPGAINLPIDQIEARLGELEPYRSGDVYVICQSGGRSARASTQLASKGFHPVDVAGGTAAWKAAGYPTE